MSRPLVVALRPAAIACSIAGLCFGGAWTTSAAVIVPDTLADDTTTNANCTLREAIIAANENSAIDGCIAGEAGLDEIVLGSGTYLLTVAGTGEDTGATGDLDILESLTITGAGAASTIIDGNDLDRVIDADPTGAALAVTITDLTIQGGQLVTSNGPNPIGESDVGGGISHVSTSFDVPASTLTLERVILTGNRIGVEGIDFGSALNSHGTVSVLASNVTGNSGGAWAIDVRRLTIEDSVVSSNEGGGLSAPVALTMSGTVVSDNFEGTGNEGYGVNVGVGVTSGSISDSLIQGNDGGLRNRGLVDISRTAIVDNVAPNGGGIYQTNLLAAFTLSNATVSGNEVGGDGGGIALTGGAATLNNVTVTDNDAVANGGGISVSGIGTSATLSNTIVAGNLRGGDCDGILTSDGHNLVGSDCTGFADGVDGDIVGADPQLADLMDNGGGSPTHALIAGSPALDAGDDATCESTDQRGVARPLEGDGTPPAICDIGAFEGSAEPTPIFDADFEVGDTSEWDDTVSS